MAVTYEKLIAVFDADTTRGEARVKAFDTLVNRFEANLRKMRGPQQLAKETETVGKQTDKTTKELQKLSATTDTMEKNLTKSSKATKQLTTDLKSADTQAKQMGSSLSKLGGAGGAGGLFSGGGLIGNISQIFSAIPGIGMLVQGAGKLVQPMEDMLKMGVLFNDTLDRAHIGFTVMIGDEKKAAAHLQELKKFAIKTPFQFEDLIGYSQALQAFGFKSEEIVDTLTMLGDRISAVPGNMAENLDRAVRSLGTIKARGGRVTGEEIREFTHLGVSLPGILAERTGQTEERIRAMITAGQIKGPNVIKLILEGMEAQTPQLMEKTMQTFTGQWSNLQDVMQQRAGQATRSLTDMLIKRMGELNEVLGSPIGDRLAAGINKGQEPVLAALDMLVMAIKAQLGIQGDTSKVTEEIGATAGASLVKGMTSKMKDAAQFHAGGMRFLQNPGGQGVQGESREAIVLEAARKWGVPAELIWAVMSQESRGHPGAVSPKGARGLMQLMPGTAKRFGVTDIFNERQNIMAGAQYLSVLRDMFGGDLDLILAGYNAGEGAVQKYGNKIPPYAETQNYVRQIKKNLAGAMLAGGGAGFTASGAGAGIYGGVPIGTMQALAFGGDAGQRMTELSNSIMMLQQNLTVLNKTIEDASAPYLVGTRAGQTFAAPDVRSIAGLGGPGGVLEQKQILEQKLKAYMAERDALVQSALAARENAALLKEITARWLGTIRMTPALPLAGGGAEYVTSLLDRQVGDKIMQLTANWTAHTEAVKSAAGVYNTFGQGLPPVMAGVEKLGAVMQKTTKLTAEQAKANFAGITGGAKGGEEFYTGMADALEKSILGSLARIEGGAKGVFKNIALSWGQTVLQMAQKAASAQLIDALFGAVDESTGMRGGGKGGILTKLFGWLLGGVAGGIGAKGTSSVNVGPTGSRHTLPFIGSLLGSRASGGSVLAGRAYQAGEVPEIFIPAQSGEIVPLGGARGRGGDTIILNLPVRPGGYYSQPRARREVAEDVMRYLTQLRRR